MMARANKWPIGWAAASLVVLVGLLLLSPGVGTESAQFGLRDAWRARLGLTIPASELEDRGVADIDGDGRVSDAEVQDFAAVASRIGFGLRFPRSLLALQVGVTLALCARRCRCYYAPLAEPYTLGIASGGARRADCDAGRVVGRYCWESLRSRSGRSAGRWWLLGWWSSWHGGRGGCRRTNFCSRA